MKWRLKMKKWRIGLKKSRNNHEMNGERKYQ